MSHEITILASLNDDQRVELQALLEEFLSGVEAVVTPGYTDVFPGYWEMCRLLEALSGE